MDNQRIPERDLVSLGKLDSTRYELYVDADDVKLHQVPSCRVASKLIAGPGPPTATTPGPICQLLK
jgi:hypothetical protein